MKRRLIFLLAAVLSASLVMGGCNGAEEKTQPAEPGITDEAEYDETLGQIYGDAITMDKVLGKDTPYVKVYICLEIGKMLGHTEDDAFQTAVESVTLSEAVQWYASENGVSVSEQAVRDYMEKCFAEIKKTKNYVTLNRNLQKQGFSFEEYYFQFPEMYRWQYIVQGPLQEGGREADTDRIVRAYKETEEYDRLLQLLICCRDACHEWGNNTEELKNAEIYYGE